MFSYSEIVRSQNAKTSHKEVFSFLNEIYEYYLSKGFVNIVISYILTTITVLIALWTFFVFLFCINFAALNDAHSIAELFILPSQLSLYSVIFISLVFVLMRAVYGYRKTVAAYKMRKFILASLELNDDMIQVIPWMSLLERISKRVRFFDGNDIEAIDLLKVMLNKENYLVAMFNKKIFNIRIPGIRKWEFTTKILEMGLRYILDANVFDEAGQIREEYLDFSNHERLSKQLRAQFKFIGLIGFIVSPFVFIGLLVYILITYADALKFSPGTLGQRTWTPLARWRFRDFNEVQHLFEERLARAHPHAEKYVEQFTNPTLETIKKFAIFIFATLLTPLLILSIIREDFLLGELILGRSALYVIGFLGGAIAMLRKSTKDGEFIYEPNEIMARLGQHTHYFNEVWVKTAHTKEVQRKFYTYFQQKIVIYLTEALSVLLTPLVFYFSLAESSVDIVSFVRLNTENLKDKGMDNSFCLGYKLDQEVPRCPSKPSKKPYDNSATMIEIQEVQRRYEKP